MMILECLRVVQVQVDQVVRSERLEVKELNQKNENYDRSVKKMMKKKNWLKLVRKVRRAVDAFNVKK